MEYSIRTDDFAQQEWEAQARLFSDYTIYQMWAYQQVRAQMEGQQVSRSIIWDSSRQPVAMCHVRIKKLTPIGPRVGYVQRGPVICHKEAGPTFDSRVFALLRASYLHGMVDVLRLVPNIVQDEQGHRVASAIEEGGFASLAEPRPYKTILVPVYDGESAIRARLHGSWRRELRKAEKGAIQIKEGNSLAHFSVLEQIYGGARLRKGFKGLDPRIFIQTQQLLSPAEKMHVILALCEDQPVSAHASSFLGEMGEGILAGSTEKGLACGASYLLWWRTLLAACTRGMRVYDTGGIDPVGNPKGYEFKRRMGGEEYSHIGAYQAAGRFTGSLVRCGEWLRRI